MIKEPPVEVEIPPVEEDEAAARSRSFLKVRKAASTRFLPAKRRGGDNGSAPSTSFASHSAVTATSQGGGGSLLLVSFLLAVVLPSIAGLLYFAMLASNIYIAEAKLTVREAANIESGAADKSSALSSVLSKVGISKGGATYQDSVIILDYLKSRAVIEDIGGSTKIASLFNRPDIDWLSRSGSDNSLEALWEYWKDHVTAAIDSTSNILTLKVRAYSPEDAYALAKELVSQSEKLVNSVTRRNREDTLARTREEVDRALTELADSRAAIASFQRQSNSVDPVQTGKQVLSLMSTLTMQQIELETQLSSASAAGAGERPGEKYLRARLAAVKTQIRELTGKLTGGETDSVTSQLKDFQLLKLKEEFAEQMFVLARSAMEEARRKLDSQQLYVIVVVPPSMPEKALYPRPAEEALVIFVICLVLWGIAALLVASVRDSRTM